MPNETLKNKATHPGVTFRAIVLGLLLIPVNTYFIMANHLKFWSTFLETSWSEFQVLTKEHFYYLGAKEENRKPMLEALVMNFTPKHAHEEPTQRVEQLLLLEKLTAYQKSERLVS